MVNEVALHGSDAMLGRDAAFKFSDALIDHGFRLEKLFGVRIDEAVEADRLASHLADYLADASSVGSTLQAVVLVEENVQTWRRMG